MSSLIVETDVQKHRNVFPLVCIVHKQNLEYEISMTKVNVVYWSAKGSYDECIDRMTLQNGQTINEAVKKKLKRSTWLSGSQDEFRH